MTKDTKKFVDHLWEDDKTPSERFGISHGSLELLDKRTFEEMYLGVWEPKYPSLEELDEMISYVESTEGLSKSEIRMRTKELRKIRKDVYSGDRLYD